MFFLFALEVMWFLMQKAVMYERLFKQRSATIDSLRLGLWASGGIAAALLLIARFGWGARQRHSLTRRFCLVAGFTLLVGLAQLGVLATVACFRWAPLPPEAVVFRIGGAVCSAASLLLFVLALCRLAREVGDSRLEAHGVFFVLACGVLGAAVLAVRLLIKEGPDQSPTALENVALFEMVACVILAAWYVLLLVRTGKALSRRPGPGVRGAPRP